MIEIRRTEQFAQWVRSLDATSRAKVFNWLDRLRLGNPGDVKPIGGGLSEMRIEHGPGLRIYFVARGAELIVVLGGGDKSTQHKDIKAAKALSQILE